MDTTIEQELHRYMERLSVIEQRRVVDFARDLAPTPPPGVSGSVWAPFSGAIPSDDIERMQVAIEVAFEQVDSDGW